MPVTLSRFWIEAGTPTWNTPRTIGRRNPNLRGSIQTQVVRRRTYKSTKKYPHAAQLERKVASPAPAAPMPKAPRHDKERVQHDVEQTPAHRADACVHRCAFGTDQIGHDNVQYGGRRAAGHGPEQILGRGVKSRGVCPEHRQQRRVEHGIPQREQHRTGKRTVKAKRRAARDGVLVFETQRTAHHAGACPTPNRLVTALKASSTGAASATPALSTGSLRPCRQIGVCKVVQHHDERADDGGHRQRDDRAWHRALLKQRHLD